MKENLLTTKDVEFLAGRILEELYVVFHHYGIDYDGKDEGFAEEVLKELIHLIKDEYGE